MGALRGDGRKEWLLLMRARKQHSRREIQSYKLDVRKLLQYGTELDLMQFLREIEIFDEDPRFAAAVNAYRALKRGKL
jgi:hypothetical protein